jgi:carbamoyltransferase
MVKSRFGPRWPRLGKLVQRLMTLLLRWSFERNRVHGLQSRYAQQMLASATEKLQRGETLYLVGMNIVGHNTGVSLVEVSPTDGVRLICNDEEERFVAIKHYDKYPAHSVELLKRRLAERGLSPRDVHAWLTTWNYIDLYSLSLRMIAEELPGSLRLLVPSSTPTRDFAADRIEIENTPWLLGAALRQEGRQPLIMLSHHENHAAFSYGVSPFARTGERVAIAVLDGTSDEGTMSQFVAEGNRLQKLYANFNLSDSLGTYYGIISSTQGGWRSLSSEGRYMGAVAWGNCDRLTNRHYRRLREIFHFGADGQLLINREIVNWHCAGEGNPYRQPLVDILGPPIPVESQWSPDAVLSVADVQHSAITRDRVDKAAAVQMVFEDGVFHFVDHLLRTTRCSKLIVTGGTALNCLSNMRLLERFNRHWFQRQLGIDACLELWVPPIPNDIGVPCGAAFNFAFRAGAKVGPSLQHAFYCGLAPTEDEISAALADANDIACLPVGESGSACDVDQLADLMAFIISRDGVLGLFQGAAETGPRALGHRSILANACHHDTLGLLNSRVKFREAIRPLAPMVTREAAERFFELAEGAAADDYNAYRYMVLTVPAKAEAKQRIPAVVHFDGTARVQIVRQETDSLSYAILKALGRRTGVEAVVNTSLNVGTPIVQTPVQAVDILRRAKAMTGLVLVSTTGEARIAYHNIDDGQKDAGRQLRAWVDEWKSHPSDALLAKQNRERFI